MNKDERDFQESVIRESIKSRMSRRTLLSGAAATAAAIAIPGAAHAQGPTVLSLPFFPNVPGRYSPESIPTMINTAITAEALAVTFLTAALGSSALGLNSLETAIVQAALVEEQDHYDVLASFGATPLTTTFTVPDPKMLTDKVTFFTTLWAAESLFVAAYLAAVREGAELGQPTFSLLAAEVMGVEAEHRTLARAALALNGDDAGIPPNDKAFETGFLLYVSDAVGVLQTLGFVGGNGIQAAYPGKDKALAAAGPMATAVIQQSPSFPGPTPTITSAADLLVQR